jgi:hypothetical protein
MTTILLTILDSGSVGHDSRARTSMDPISDDHFIVTSNTRELVLYVFASSVWHQMSLTVDLQASDIQAQ